MIMLFELAHFGEDGEIVHGGVKATAETVAKWIEGHIKDGYDGQLMIVPADEYAVTIKEAKEMCKNL